MCNSSCSTRCDNFVDHSEQNSLILTNYKIRRKQAKGRTPSGVAAGCGAALPAPLDRLPAMAPLTLGGRPVPHSVFWGVLAVSGLSAVLFSLTLAPRTRRLAAASDVVRVALLSDPHMVGPQYTLGSESNALDNLSVLKTQQRLWGAVQSIRAMSPPPDAALFLGDVVHDGLHYTTDWELLTNGPVNGYHIASSVLGELGVPTLYCFGNHDYRVRCGSAQESADRQLSARLFRHFLHSPPYSAADIGGWRVVMLNSQLGYTWDWQHPDCNIRLASYGPQQLAWLERQLAAGRPTLVALHFPLPASATDEGGGASLLSVLSAHDNVKLVLSGHFHKGVDWEGLYPWPHITLPAIRYDEQNFFLLELHTDGSFRFLDQEKNRGGARCSDTWRYDGAPALESNRSQGDCGLPLAADTPSYILPHIASTADIPQTFNPEMSCSLRLAAAVLEPCTLHGPSPQCCALLSTQFSPTSSWPFASCLCKPSFWQGVEQLFQQAGGDAAAVVDQCRASTGSLILRRGAGACPALEAGEEAAGAAARAQAGSPAVGG